MSEIRELQKKYLLPTYTPELLFVRGEGSLLFDDKGNQYLDFASGIGVCSLGHSHPAIAEAVAEQAKKLVHISNLYMNENQPRLAQKLVDHCFPGAVFFANSGAEANEGMIKLARRYGSENGGRFEIITMEDSFHGRTLATLAATGRAKYRKGFEPHMPGFIHIPFNDIESLEKHITSRTCAVMIEPVQGEGGVIPADPEFLKAARELCDENNIMLLFDEVQCGMGRTGEFFAWQKYGVQPDAVSLAKALGNGFPIGAFIVQEKFTHILQAGTHASTFGGTPLACAAALAVIDTFDRDNITMHCEETSKYLMEKLIKLKSAHSAIKEVRGLGLMIGIVFDHPAGTLRELTEKAGLLTLTAGENVLRLLPPLTVTKAEVDKAVEIIDSALKENTLK